MPTSQRPAGHVRTTAVVWWVFAFCDWPPPEPSRIFAAEKVSPA
jgi:hypothetical protein